ncbi:MAG: hypothetical protein EYC62_05375 [Alphaproteobacteria bacterium]|nr:MAG: hypothetical protein EYC62_05375 [Alphaproteobacteria bacterium]
MQYKLLILAMILAFQGLAPSIAHADWNYTHQAIFDGEDPPPDGGGGGDGGEDDPHDPNQTLDCQPVGDAGWDCRENIP